MLCCSQQFRELSVKIVNHPPVGQANSLAGKLDPRRRNENLPDFQNLLQEGLVCRSSFRSGRLLPPENLADDLEHIGRTPADDLELGLAANAGRFVAGNFADFQTALERAH